MISDEAYKTLHRWFAFCKKQTGMQNVFMSRNKRYFFEISQREYDDGSISGTILVEIPGDEGKSTSKKASDFKINGDGSIEKAPSILRKL